jgi:hypothetical protein
VASSGIIHNGYTAVSLQTKAGTKVRVTLQVQHQLTAATAKNGLTPSASKSVALFSTSITGVADKHGRFSGLLHVTYTPKHAMVARVEIAVQAGKAISRRTFQVVMQP